MRIRTFFIHLALLPLLTGVVMAPPPLGTSFTYQGRLTVGAAVANGSYDLKFSLFDAASSGSQVGASLTNTATAVTNGLFTVSLDFGSGVFIGDPRWLEIGVRTNGSGAFSALSPRQALTPSPYAFYAPSAGTAASAATATVANSVAAGSILNSSLAANAVTSDKIADGTIGNADISATADINAGKILGGDLQADRLKVGAGHTLTGIKATVAGGTNNTASGYASSATGEGAIASGYASTAMGFYNTASGDYSTAMGTGSTASGYASTAMGEGATASAYVSVAIGEGAIARGEFSAAIGNHTLASGDSATAIGDNCDATNIFTMAAGFRAKAYHKGSFVWGDSTDSEFSSTANNQFLIRASGNVGINKNNPATALDVNGTVTATNFSGSGGQPLEFKVNGLRALRLEDNGDSSDPGTTPDGAPNVIGGSPVNYTAPDAVGSVIAGGGATNFFGAPYSNATFASYSAVGGGAGNQIGAYSTLSTIGGGSVNSIGTNSGSSTIGGGWVNIIGTNAGSATISGGASNIIRYGAEYATIPGGRENTATNYAFAAGRQAKAEHAGTFVWADASGTAFASTGNNQFLIRASGNVGINKNNPATALDVNGIVTATAFAGSGAGLVNIDAGNITNGDLQATRLKVGSSQTLSGSYSTIAGGSGNIATNNYAVVSGGQRNRAGGGVSAVAGGQDNTASGDNSFVGAGAFNKASAGLATVSGGGSNTASGFAAFIGGGGCDGSYYIPNIASGTASAIAGGVGNSVSDVFTTVGGGRSNKVTAGAAVIAGGDQNTASGAGAVIGGGYHNQAEAVHATIVGGASNRVTGISAFIGAGGWDGGSYKPNMASGTASVIGGGLSNKASETGSSVGGGYGNTAGAYAATVPGGVDNAATNYAATVGGGQRNIANGEWSAVGGGSGNIASNRYSTVPGGTGNTASGTNSFAAGYYAVASHPGSFVWSSGESTSSWGDNTFTVRAHGGARIYTSNTNTGVQLNAGGGSWASLSDRNAKENFEELDYRQILEQVAAVPVTKWNLKSQPAGIRHIGPMAQDFAAAFGVGEDNTHITTSDADGVALAAIKGLNQKLEERNAALEKQVTELMSLVQTLAVKVNGGGQ